MRILKGVKPYLLHMRENQQILIRYRFPGIPKPILRTFLKDLYFYFSLLGRPDPDRLLIVLGLHSIMLTVFHCALIWN